MQPSKPRTPRLRRHASLRDGRFALGIGIGIPDALPLEAHYFWNRYIAIRGSVTAAMPFNVRVQLPQDELSSKGGIIIENPEIEIKLKARYGPLVALDTLVFPFGTSFFLSFGGSYRTFSLAGSTQAPLLIHTSGSDETITTRTQFGLRAKATTSAILIRGSLGWLWPIFRQGYVSFTLAGIAAPTAIKRSVGVEGYLDAPGDGNDNVEGALEQVKVLKEDELEEKAHKEIRPAEEQILPMIGIGIGYVF